MPNSPDILGAIGQGLSLRGQREQLAGAPARQELQGLQLQGARDQSRVQSIVQGAQQLKGITTPQGKIDFLMQRRAQLQTAGIGTEDTDEAIQLAQGGRFDLLEDITDKAIALGQGLRGKTAGQREFESLTKGLSEDKTAKAREIALGLTGKASGAAPQIFDIGGVPHIFDKQEKRAIPVSVGGKDVTTASVADSKAKIAQAKKFAELTGASRAKTIDKSFATMQAIDKNTLNIDRAITELEGGAGTGAIEGKFFPSIKAASIKLDQIQGELALDIVGATTFGALSKGELDLARTIALPKGLSEPELIKFLQEKKAANNKLRAYYNEQIQHLDQGGTIASFTRAKEREKELAPESGAPDQGSAQEAPQSFTSSSGISFTVE